MVPPPSSADGEDAAVVDDLERVVRILLFMYAFEAQELAHRKVEPEFFAKFSLATGGG